MITKDLNLKRRSTHCVLSFILQRCKFENKNIVKIEQTYIAQETLYSRQTVSTELKYLQEQGYITYKRALFNNLTTTEITLTEKSIAILNAEASKAINKPQNKTIKTEPSQPQAEVEKAPQTAPKQVETEQSDKVTCKSIEEVLELLNYQAERFADGKQNEFEFRRVAKYIASKNMQLSKNIRYDEDNNKFVNFA